MTDIYKIELCRGQFRENETLYYKGRQSAETGLRNHKRNCSNNHRIEEVELDEGEWLCCFCNKLQEGIECDGCNKSRHSMDAIPNTELAEELNRKTVLKAQGIDYEIDKEVVKEAKGVSL